METISLKLPVHLLKRLERAAKARRLTRSELIRQSLQKQFGNTTPARGSSCYDLARDLPGEIRGLPQDLAENPKYMQSFGK